MWPADQEALLDPPLCLVRMRPDLEYGVQFWLRRDAENQIENHGDYRDARGPGHHDLLGDVEGAGLVQSDKGEMKSLGNGQIIYQRAIHSHEGHIRNLMMDSKRSFFTRTVIEQRSRPSERCPDSFPRKLSRLG